MRAVTEGGSDATADFVWTPEAQRVRDVVDMHEFGVALYRQRMRREHPSAKKSEIDALVRSWLIDQPIHGRARAMREHRDG